VQVLKNLKSLWGWLWCSGSRERAVKDAGDKLQMSMRVTAKSRYNAAVRLQHQGRFSFLTTVVFSLGLIFIPLLQNADVRLALQPAVLNMMQVFLAVAVLVYSVVIGTARYEVRAENLTECGDKLKELIREMDREREERGQIGAQSLASYQTRYSDIVTDSENHTRSDYYIATLEMRNDYFITGLPWLKTFAFAHASRGIAYVVPMLMIVVEVALISDMLGATGIFSPYLRGVPTGGG
jgi:hypothetical protein